MLHSSLPEELFTRVGAFLTWREVALLGFMVTPSAVAAPNVVWRMMCISAVYASPFLVLPPPPQCRALNEAVLSPASGGSRARNSAPRNGWERLFRERLLEGTAAYAATDYAAALLGLEERFAPQGLRGCMVMEERGWRRAALAPHAVDELDNNLLHACMRPELHSLTDFIKLLVAGANPEMTLPDVDTEDEDEDIVVPQKSLVHLVAAATEMPEQLRADIVVALAAAGAPWGNCARHFVQGTMVLSVVTPLDCALERGGTGDATVRFLKRMGAKRGGFVCRTCAVFGSLRVKWEFGDEEAAAKGNCPFCRGAESGTEDS